MFKLLQQAYDYIAPDPIDTDTIYNMAKSPVVDDMLQRAKILMDDPTSSPQYANKEQQLRGTAADTLFASNIANARSRAGAGQNVNVNQGAAQDATTSGNIFSQISDKLGSFTEGLYDKGMGMLNQAGGWDMQARQAMASAEGQNVTNMNNFRTSMGSMGMNALSSGIDKMGGMSGITSSIGSLLGGAGGAAGGAASGLMSLLPMIACDAKLKENIKPIGKAKTKNGNIVNLYNYNYKGRKKKHTGVIAQDVMRVEPQAVKKGKNKLLYVNMGELFS
jgi:hypothetical protein